MEIRCVAPSRSKVGEGAVWDDRAQVLWWVDIHGERIHRHDPTTGENCSTEFGEPVGCLAVRDSGGLVIAGKSGFWLFDPETGRREHLCDPESHLAQSRFNDGATDSRGRFWAGTMKEGGRAERLGRFYRLDPDRSLTPWRGEFFVTNGLAFSPDGRKMYFSDSSPEVRTIWTCDYDPETGMPGAPRVFLDTVGLAGRPDGATVDAEGCYWFAGVGGWQIYRISTEGRVLRAIDVPVEKPSKPMFGGPDLETLYITSIGSGISAGSDTRQPEAGGLFAITGLGVRGLPQARFPG